MRIKESLTVLVMLLIVCGAWGSRISQEEAYRIAGKFFSNTSAMKKAPSDGQSAVKLAHVSDGYFAFNRGNAYGYVIVAADNNARAEVLGYADEGTFDIDSMPVAMKWWLSEYERELEFAAQTSDNAVKPRFKKQLPTYNAIAPLLTSLWGQDEPYNALCPEYQGEKCPTGCVATAIAQIMYHHKWPEKGTGSHTYEWTVNEQAMGTMSADFSKSVYDWNAMTPQYGNTSTQQSKDAVAKLMYDIGVASNMQYFPTGSGAYSSTAIQAMTEYFGYDPSVELLQRNYYGLAEWQEFIYNSLAEGRPVFYSASTAANEGHAFICDGYNDGYFHINWGWNGMSNGYFLLTALDPDAQGTGGGSSGYNYGQMAAAGIRPAEPGSAAVPLMYCTGTFYVEPTNTTTSSTVTFGGGMYNYGISTINVNMGIKVTDNAGNVTYIASNDHSELDLYYGYNYFNVPLKQFPQAAGTYKVYPAFRDNSTGDWFDIRSAIYQPQYLVAKTNGNGIIEFSYPEGDKSTLTVTGMETTSTLYAGKPFKIKATISNSGHEFMDDIFAVAVPTGLYNAATISEGVLIDLPDGESIDVEFTLDAPSTAGDYDLILVNSGNSQISERLTVSIGTAPEGETALSILSPLYMPDADNASADNIRFTADIACTSGFYGNKLYAFAFRDGESSSSTALISDLFIGAGENRTVTFAGSLPQAVVGETYQIYVFYIKDNKYTKIPSQDNNHLKITIGSLTGINGTESGTMAGEIRIYNLAGECVLRQYAAKPDLTSLAPGIYIVKTAGTTKCVAKQ